MINRILKFYFHPQKHSISMQGFESVEFLYPNYKQFYYLGTFTKNRLIYYITDEIARKTMKMSIEF